jgi:hypothetical protein
LRYVFAIGFDWVFTKIALTLKAVAEGSSKQ